MRDELTIAVVNWNARDFLRACLQSIQSQEVDFEKRILLVDNGSTDGSVDFVSAEFPDVEIARMDENLGYAAGCNVGIKQSRSTFVCLMNPDTIMLPGCLSELVRFCQSSDRIGLVGPQVLLPDRRVQRSSMCFPTLPNLFGRALAIDEWFPNGRLGSYLQTGFAHDRTSRVEVVNGCCWLIRRQAIGEVGLLDERLFMYGEDVDWCWRFWKCGWEVWFCSAAKMIHYGGGSSKLAPLTYYLEQQKANSIVWSKHRPAWTYPIYRFVMILHHGLRFLGYRFLALFPVGSTLPRAFKATRSWAAMAWLMGIRREQGSR
ncbi:MAG: glycosyltransferase family 2 protein [Acidobacteriota bacterium]